MTLYEIIDTLKKIALTQPNVRTATDGDIYEKMNGNPSVRYGVFHVVQTTHTEDEQFDNYGFNLFMIDRLEDDGANRISAQSTAKQLLSNIIGTFCETFDADHKDIVYQSFTQKFKDNTCGVWASVTMQVIKDYSCAEAYDGVWRPEIVIINNEDITITENGTYEPSDGFTGFGKIEVALPIPNVKESDTLYLTAGDTGTYRPEAPYTAVEEVKYEVEPNQYKVLNISENGEYVVMPDEYYGGLGAVEVNVNYKPKYQIPNGMCFKDSTWETFPMENYDWSNITDGSYMFYNCQNLDYTEVVEYIKDGKLDVKTPMYMFCKNNKTTVIDGIDFTKFYNAYMMFGQQGALREVRNCIFPKKQPYGTSTAYCFPIINMIDTVHKFKAIDCDWSNVDDDVKNVVGGCYFANINVIGETWEELPYYEVVVVDMPKPAHIKTNSNTTVWYNPENGEGWDTALYTKPWGFWFKSLINNDEIESIKISNKYGDVIDLPFDGEKYIIDYPYSKYWNVLINDKVIPPLENKNNIEFYYPSNRVGLYQGKDIEKLIYYTFEDGWFEITEKGLKAKYRYSSDGEQRISTPTDTVAIHYEAVTSGGKYVYINNTAQTITGNAGIITCDTSNLDYIGLKMYVDKPDDFTITKIEII